MPTDDGSTQPNVHALADDLLGHVLRGAPTHPNPKEGGGSANMGWMLLVQRYFSDPAKYRQQLLDALDLHEKVGWLSWGPAGGRCEQGIASPHIELHLNWSGLLLLQSVRNNDHEIVARMQRFFFCMYALALPCMTPKGQVLSPGARMSDFGPADKTLDMAVAAIGGKVTDFKQAFRNLDRSTCGVWAILEALKRIPFMFDATKMWTLDGIEQHWPVLRWPLKIHRYQDGHIASLLAHENDAAMGKVGSGGFGVDEVRVQYSTSRIAWAQVGLTKLLGNLDNSATMGEPVRMVGRAF